MKDLASIAEDSPSLETLLDCLSLGVLVFRQDLRRREDPVLVLEEANDAASFHLGSNVKDRVGQTIAEALPDAASPDVIERLTRVAAGGSPVHVHRFHYFNGRGDPKWLHAAAFPLDGGRVGVAFEDVTRHQKVTNSLKYSAQLLDAVEQAVIATDVEYHIVFWNRFAERLYGWRADEAFGHSVIDLLVAGGSTALPGAVGESVSGEFILKRKDGTTFPAYVVRSSIITDGVVTGFVGVSRDISDQKRAEEILRASEARYRALVSAVPDLIFRLDSEGRYLDFAGPSDTLLVPMEAFLGRRAREILPAEVAEAVERGISSALAAQRVTKIEYELEIGGGRRAFEAMIAPDGPSEVVSVTRDVTDRKHDRESLAQLLTELEARVIDRTSDMQKINELLADQIEKRLHAEDELRTSYARLQTMLNAAPAAIIELDCAGRVISWNRSAERMFGWTAAEALGCYNPAVRTEAVEDSHVLLRLVTEGGTIDSMPLERHTKAGTVVHVNVSTAPIRGKNGAIERIVVVYTLHEDGGAARLEELTRKMQELKSLSLAVSGSLDLQQAMSTLEAELANAFGIRSGVLFLLNEVDQLEQRHAWGKPLIDAEATTGPADDEIGFVTDRATMQVWLRAPVRHAGGRSGVLFLALPEKGIATSIELLRAMAHQVCIAITNALLFDVVRRGNDRLQNLSRRLVAVQEEERRHIGRELHDQIGQMLTGLKFSLAAARNGDAGRDALGDAERVATELTERIRRLSLELRPPMLDDAGLVPALTWHVERYAEQTGISVEFRHGNVGRFNPDLETAVFRIVQEAMTNAARHARAKHVWLRVWVAADRLLVEIEDDGVGFSPSGIDAPPTAGLTGMRERARLVGGSIIIESEGRSGTLVAVDLPAVLLLVSQNAHDRHRR